MSDTCNFCGSTLPNPFKMPCRRENGVSLVGRSILGEFIIEAFDWNSDVSLKAGIFLGDFGLLTIRHHGPGLDTALYPPCDDEFPR